MENTSFFTSFELGSIHGFIGYGSREFSSGLQNRPNAHLKHVLNRFVQICKNASFELDQDGCSSGLQNRSILISDA